MFNGVVASLMTRYLSTYLKDVRAEQLDISARGEVELRDVELREEPLSELLVATGSALRGGRVARVSIQLQGWGGMVVNLDGLTVLLCASTPPRPQSAQQFEIDRIAVKRALLVRTSMTRSTPSALSSFIARLGQKILGRVEMHVTGVHVRYEDALSDPHAPFVLGVRVGSLSMESTSTAGIAKRLMVREVSLYGGRVRDALTGLASLATNDDVFARMDAGFHPHATPSSSSPASAPASAPSFTSIINPFDLDATVDLSTPAGAALPEMQVTLHVPPIVAALHQQQLQCLIAATWWARTAALRLERRRERPTEKVEGHATEWWQYILRTVLHRLRDKRRRHSLAFITRRKHIRSEYISLHAQRIHAQARGVSVPAATAARLLELEDSDEMTVSDIVLFRSAAEALAATDATSEAEDRKEASAVHASWTKWLWSGAGVGTAAALIPPAPPLSTLSTDQKRYIYQALGMGLTEGSALAPAAASTRVVTVKVQSIEVTLHLASARPLLSARLAALYVKAEDGPKGQHIEAKLERVEVRDTWSRHTHYPVILRPRYDDFNAWLKLDYEAPLELGVSPRLKVEVGACNAVLNLAWADQVGFFFAASAADFASPAESAVAGEDRSWDDRALTLNVAITEPHIVVPEAIEADAAWLLVVTASSVNVRSEPSPPVEAFIGAHYARHTLSLHRFGASLFDPSKPADQHTILAPFDLSLALHTLLRQTARAPPLRLFGEVPLVEGAMSAHEMGKLLAIVVRLLYFVPSAKLPTAPTVSRLSPLSKAPAIAELNNPPQGPPAAEIQLLFTRVRFAVLQADGRPFATALADEALLQLAQSHTGRADVTMTVRRLGLDISEAGAQGVYLLRNWEQGGAPVPLRLRLAFTGAVRPTLRHGGSLAMVDTVDLELQTGALFITPHPAALEQLLAFTHLLAHHRLPDLVSALAPESAITFLRLKASCAGAQVALLDEQHENFATLNIGELQASVQAAETTRAQVSLATCFISVPNTSLPPPFSLSGGVALSFSSVTSPLGPPPTVPDELKVRIGVMRVALSLPFIQRVRALLRMFQAVHPAPSLQSAPIPVQIPTSTSTAASVAATVQLQVALGGAEAELRSADEPVSSAVLCRLGPLLLFSLSRHGGARSFHASLADADLSTRPSPCDAKSVTPLPLVRGIAFSASLQMAPDVPLRIRVSLAPSVQLCISAEALEQAARLGKDLAEVLQREATVFPAVSHSAYATPPPSPPHSHPSSPALPITLVHSFASPSPPAAPVAVQVTFDAPRVAVLLLGKAGAILLSGKLQNFQVRASTATPERMLVSVHLGALSATDPSKEALVHAAASPVVSVALSITPEGLSLHLRVIGLRVNVTPGAVRSFASFGPLQLPRNATSALSESHAPPSVSATSVRKSFELRAEVKDMALSLQAEANKISLATGLRVSVTVPTSTLQPARTVALIDRLCVRREVSANEEAVLLAPAEVTLEVEDNSESMRASVECGALHIAVSGSDLTAAARLASQLSGAVPPSPIREVDTSTIADASAAAASLRPYSVRVRCGKAAVTLITDLDGVDLPVASLRLLDLRIDGRTERLGGGEARLQCVLDGRAFRLEQGGWDSLIEPWPLAVSFAAPPVGPARLQVSAPRVLDLNVTKTLYLRLLSIAAQAARPPGAQARSPITPRRAGTAATDLLVLRNTTGVEIEYLLVGISTRTSPPRRMRVAPDEQTALVQPQRQRRGLLSLPSLRGATLSIFIPGYQPLVGLELHRVHSRVIVLAPLVPMGSSTLRVRYEVHLEGATRVAELAGAVSVLNSCPLPIELSEQFQRWACVLPPGMRRLLPLHVSASLRLRPLPPQQSVYEWSEPLQFPIQAGIKTEALAASLPKAAHKDPVLAVALNAEQTESGFISVELRTPVVLENLTCSELHYKLFAHEEHKCSGRINAGSEEGVLTVGEWETIEQATLSLKLHLTGWEPAHLSLVPAHDGSEQRSTLRLLDQHNRSLMLEASVVMGGIGSPAALRVTVWAKFVLLNRTQLPLLFRQFKRSNEFIPGRSNKLAAGQALEDSEEEDDVHTPGEDDDEAKQAERTEQKRAKLEAYRLRREARGVRAGGEEALLFSFLGTDLIEHRMQVRVAGDTHWSLAFRIDQTATATSLVLRQRNGKGELYLGVYVQLGQGRYRRSRVVTFDARWVFVNGLSRSLHVRQATAPGNAPAALTVPAGESAPLHWPQPLSEAEHDSASVVLALGESGVWGGAIPVSSQAEFAIKLQLPAPRQSEFAHAEIALERATWTVRFVPLPISLPPYRLENCSPFVVRVHQRDVEEHEPITLTPYESVPYAWRCPAEPHRLALHIPALDYLRIFAPDKLKSWDVVLPSPSSAADAHLPVAAASPVSLVVESFSDGPTRVLRLLDRTKHTPISSSRNAAGSADAVSMEIDVQLAGAGLSLVDDREELLYFSLSEASAKVALGSISQRFDARVGRAQIDTQVEGARYPVALFLRSPVGVAPPALQLSVERSWEYRDVLYLPRFRLAVGASLLPDSAAPTSTPSPSTILPPCEMEVRLDEVLLVRLARFADFQLLPRPRSSRLRLSPFLRHTVAFSSMPAIARQESLLAAVGQPKPSPIRDKVMVYMEALELGAVRMRLTFTSSPGTDESRDANNPLRLLGALGVAGLAANVDAAPLFLDSLQLAHPYCSSSELAVRVGRHYSQQLLDGVYKVLGSFSALGSPTALVSAVGAGVHDFFNEPVQALTSATSPASFALGLQRGTASLLKRSLYGVFNSAAKLSGTLGQGISWLSLDQDYLRQRAAAPRPRDVTEGFTLGAQELLGGVVRGLSGIIASPVRGAVGGGFPGLLSGIGQGVLGVGVKPVVGAVDFATRTAQGIAALADEPAPERVRAPRLVQPDGLVRAYDPKAAAGQLLLRVVVASHDHKHPERDRHNSGHEAEHYRSHVMLPESRALLISTGHIYLLYVAAQGTGGAAASLDWRLSLRRLRDVQVGERGVVILHATAKSDADSAAAVFGRGALKTRQINAGSDEVTVQLRDQIEHAMEDWKAAQVTREGL